MTDDEKIAAVQDGLAGIIRCENCGRKLQTDTLGFDFHQRHLMCYSCWMDDPTRSRDFWHSLDASELANIIQGTMK